MCGAVHTGAEVETECFDGDLCVFAHVDPRGKRVVVHRRQRQLNRVEHITGALAYSAVPPHRRAHGGLGVVSRRSAPPTSRNNAEGRHVRVVTCRRVVVDRARAHVRHALGKRQLAHDIAITLVAVNGAVVHREEGLDAVDFVERAIARLIDHLVVLAVNRTQAPLLRRPPVQVRLVPAVVPLLQRSAAGVARAVRANSGAHLWHNGREGFGAKARGVTDKEPVGRTPQRVRCAEGHLARCAQQVEPQNVRVLGVDGRVLGRHAEHEARVAHKVLVERAVVADDDGDGILLAAPRTTRLLPQTRSAAGVPDLHRSVKAANVHAKLKRCRCDDTQQAIAEQVALNSSPVFDSVTAAIGLDEGTEVHAADVGEARVRPLQSELAHLAIPTEANRPKSVRNHVAHQPRSLHNRAQSSAHGRLNVCVAFRQLLCAPASGLHRSLGHRRRVPQDKVLDARRRAVVFRADQNDITAVGLSAGKWPHEARKVLERVSYRRRAGNKAGP
eukprot:Opistho-1_new@49364